MPDRGFGVSTCFLFAEYLSDEDGLCLRLDQHGQVDAPLERRTLDEIKALQLNARTIVILSAERCSLHEIELPWLNESKARAAIPYALEEHVAQNVNSLHFAFDRKYYQQGRYLVTVIDKAYLQALMTQLEKQHLAYDAITIDWFALNPGEICVTETGLLAHTPDYKGAISRTCVEKYLTQHPAQSPIMTFLDSVSLLPANHSTLIDQLSYVWIAERLLQHPLVNLCQGELAHDKGGVSYWRWYQAGCILLLVWFIILLGSNGVIWFVLTEKNRILDQKIALIYQKFFPGARQVISPQFRISHLLQNADKRSDGPLWHLLEQLSLTFKHEPLTINQLRFQNQSLTITLACKSFADLERIENNLQQAKIQVRQIEAASQAQQVVAVLELSA